MQQIINDYAKKYKAGTAVMIDPQSYNQNSLGTYIDNALSANHNLLTPCEIYHLTFLSDPDYRRDSQAK